MVMEFVRGETFDSVFAACSGRWRSPRRAALHAGARRARARASRRHRPSRSEAGQPDADRVRLVKVMDFGLARMAGTEHLTNDGYMVGTPAYMSPEQVLGGEIDGRADLYAMGVVLFRLLTGAAAVQGRQRHRDGAEAAPRSADAGAPAAARNCPRRARRSSRARWPRRRDDRFQTADDLKGALRVLSELVSSEITRTMASPLPQSRVGPTLQPTLRTPASSIVRPCRRSVAAAPAPPPAAAPAPTAVARKPVAVMAAVAIVAWPRSRRRLFIWRGRPADSAVVPDDVAAPAASEPVVAAAPAPTPPAVATPPAAAPRRLTRRRCPKTAPASKPRPEVGARASRRAAAPHQWFRARPAFSSITFSKMKYLTVAVDGKVKDQDAQLRLDGEALHVVDDGKTLQTAAYSDVIGLFHSHSKEPKWTGPTGRPCRSRKSAASSRSSRARPTG